MSKHTNPKQTVGLASPTSHEHELAQYHPSGGALQRAAAPAKAPASRPKVAGPSPSHEQIAARAYQLWVANGQPGGTDRADWFEAERLLRAEN
jgi:Protein of unknown function (DUF2934)